MHEDNVLDGSKSTFDSIIHLKKHEEGPFDQDYPRCFDPGFAHGIFVCGSSVDREILFSRLSQMVLIVD